MRVIPRGAGTSLSGGALPLADAVVLGLMRMNRILEIDYADRCAVVQAGVTNIGITEAVQGQGFFYAPDPSSQLACMIGGNVNMNSGGAHCLKYGVTANNLLGLKMVTIEGEILDIGGAHLDAAGYDWLGLLTGSEGQLVVVTEVTVRILRGPEGARAMLVAFGSNEIAGACVDAIISSGIIPVALEFMDRPAIHACEAFAHAGYPLDAEAMLIIEVEGSVAEQDWLLDQHPRHLRAVFDPLSLKVSQSAEESLAIWKGRKGAFGAIGRISPDYLCMDGTIPTSQLAPVLRRIGEIERCLRAEGGQHLPRRRRQSASADHVRRQQSRQPACGGGIRRRHPETMRGGRRLPDRGAWRGRGEARPDGRAVLRDRARPAAPHQIRLRSRLAAQSQQGLSPPGRRGRGTSHPGARRGMNALAAPMEAPVEEAGFAAAIADAAAAGEPVLVRGNASKMGMLRPVQAARVLSTANHWGITLYSPQELILSARAGTYLTNVEAALAEKGQHLIAEPPDFSALLGNGAPQSLLPQSLGGVVAANLSGPRRVAWGAMRDHVMGVRAVNGLGETIHSGGRVLKNVTGLDLCKLLTGSHGTLGVITEITLKVLPAPEATGTLLLAGLDAEEGVAALSAGLGSPYSVSAAAWLPAEAAALVPGLGGFGRSVALLRIEDFATSVDLSHRAPAGRSGAVRRGGDPGRRRQPGRLARGARRRAAADGSGGRGLARLRAAIRRPRRSGHAAGGKRHARLSGLGRRAGLARRSCRCRHPCGGGAGGARRRGHLDAAARAGTAACRGRRGAAGSRRPGADHPAGEGGAGSQRHSQSRPPLCRTLTGTACPYRAS